MTEDWREGSIQAVLFYLELLGQDLSTFSGLHQSSATVAGHSGFGSEGVRSEAMASELRRSMSGVGVA